MNSRPLAPTPRSRLESATVTISSFRPLLRLFPTLASLLVVSGLLLGSSPSALQAQTPREETNPGQTEPQAKSEGSSQTPSESGENPTPQKLPDPDPAKTLEDDPPPGTEEPPPSLIGGLDFSSPEKLEQEKASIREELSRITENDPRRETKQNALNQQLQIIQEHLVLLESVRLLANRSERVTPQAQAQAETQRNQAQKNLDDEDSDAAIESLKEITDLSELRKKIQDEFRTPADKAKQAVTNLTKSLEQRANDVEANSQTEEEARRRLAEHREKISEIQKELAEEDERTDDQRAFLQRRLAIRQQGASSNTAKLAYLQNERTYLNALQPILEIQAQSARLRFQLLEQRAKSAESLLAARIEEESKAAQRELLKKQEELSRTQDRHEKLAQQEEIENLKIDAANKSLLTEETQEVSQRDDLLAELTEILEELERDQAIYRGDRGANPRPPLALVQERILDLRNLTDKFRHRQALEADNSRQSEIQQAIANSKEEIDNLEIDVGQLRDKARAEFLKLRQSDGENAKDAILSWETQDERWSAILSARRNLLHERVTTLESIADLLQELSSKRTSLFETRRNLLGLLQRENLFVRGESNITWDAVSLATRDIPKLPLFLATKITEINQVLREKSSRDFGRTLLTTLALIALITIPLLFCSHWLTRRIRHLHESPLESLPERTALTIAYLTRAACRSAILFSIPSLVGFLAGDTFTSANELLRELGIIMATIWFARCANQEFFRPRPATRAVFALEPEVAHLLWRRLTWILILSSIFLPLGHLLRHLGYENRGAIELVDLAYKLLIGFILTTVLVRKRVVTSLLPPPTTPLGKALGFIVSALHPVIALLIPTLLVLTVLQYEILAGIIAEYSIILLVVSLSANIVFYGICYLVNRRFPADTEREEVSPEEIRVQDASRQVTTFVVRITTLVAAGWAIVTLGGFSFDEVQSLLSVPLPFQGIDVEKKVTFWNLIVATIILAVFIPSTQHLKLALRSILLPRTQLDPGVQYTITTLVGYAVVGLGVYLSLKNVFRLDNLGYVVAALSVGIGFGLQEIVSNFISGLILLLERPLKVGDVVEVGDTEGIVKKINIRATTVQTRDNVWILVPNRDFITKEVVNVVYTDPKLRLHINVGVAYGSDTGLVRKVLLEVADQDKRVFRRPIPEVHFTEFADSSLNFTLLVWIGDPINQYRIASDLRFAVDAAFRRHNIQIPFPQRDLHLKSSEPVRVVVERPDPSEEGTSGS